MYHPATKIIEDKRFTHLATIKGYIKSKYNLSEEEISVERIMDAQTASLIARIEEKICHGKLFEARHNPHVDIKQSSKWLKHGNISPKDEAFLCLLQDRNVFTYELDKIMCNHRKEKRKTVDHLATRCEKMLYHDYTFRHNEVVRCLHLMICNRFGMKNVKRLRTHSVQEIMSNSNVEIRVDTRIRTDANIRTNHKS